MARCRLISNFILSMSLACIGLQPAAHAAIGDNLELYLELNETAGLAAADSSGNGRTGAVVNRGGNLQNITLDGDPLPGDPLANDTYFWTPGRFGGGFAPGGAPDADGDPNPPFCNGDMCLDEDEFGNKQPSHYQGSAYAMVGVNLTNGATTGGIPAEIEGQQFTYSFHVRMPYNRRYSKTVGGYIEGSETVTRDQVMFDAHSVAPSGWGLDSSQTNFWNGTVLSGSPLDHMSGTNRWTWFQVNDQDQLFYHYRGGAVDLRTVNDPALFDLSTSNGDYNLDGSTNIADYVLWRDNLGAAVPSPFPGENPNAATPGLVDQEDYEYWKANYGNGPEENLPANLVDGEWHHVVLVQDYTIAPADGSIKDSFLYIDGELVSWDNENKGSTAVNAVFGAITLGSSSSGRGGDASRFIYDDFAMWTRVLSQEEITMLSTQSLSSLLAANANSIVGTNVPEPTSQALVVLVVLGLSWMGARNRVKRSSMFVTRA